MICIVCTGNPLPNVTWYKDGVTPPQRQLGIARYTQWAIILEDLVTTDSGNYTCKVSNENGCIDFTYKVEIIGKNSDDRRIIYSIISFSK